MPSPTPDPDSTAVLIGRFSLVHRGHEALLQEALRIAETVVVVLGSSFRARDPRHPFTWQERAKMLQAALTPAQRERVKFLPVRDYYDDTRWNAAVAEGVHAQAAREDRITLVTCDRDLSTHAIQHFPQWQRRVIATHAGVDATAMRDVYFSDGDREAALAVMEPYVSEPVRAYLQAWSRLPEYGRRVREHEAVKAYRRKWTADSYLTADAVVQVGGQVLLVRRGGEIGAGLWALPGGFVERHERFLDAAMRELREETHFPMMEMSLRQALQDSACFDSPVRSARGRIVTQAFHFRFGAMDSLPEVSGGDDAQAARWFALQALPALEAELFEDHFIILDRFLRLLPQA